MFYFGIMRKLFSKKICWAVLGILVPTGLAGVMSGWFGTAYTIVLVGGAWWIGRIWLSETFQARSKGLNKLKRKALQPDASPKALTRYDQARHQYWLHLIGQTLLALIVTGVFLFWVRSEQTAYELQQLEGWLKPLDLPTPPNPCDGYAPSEAVKILVGSMASFITEFPSTILMIKEEPILVLDRNKNGEIAVTMDIYDEQDNIVVAINKNKFTLNNDIFDHPREDHGSLKVVLKKRKEKVLNIRYLNKRAIQIEGVFRHPGSPALKVDGKQTLYGPFVLADGCVGNARQAQFAFD